MNVVGTEYDVKIVDYDGHIDVAGKIFTNDSSTSASWAGLQQGQLGTSTLFGVREAPPNLWSGAGSKAENALEEDHGDCVVVYYNYIPLQLHDIWRDHYYREVPHRTGRNAPEAPTSSLGVSEENRPGAPSRQCPAPHFKGDTTEVERVGLEDSASFVRPFAN
ncbi:hypothetical protein RB195_021435 [Necator americanus]|uniref:Uncharacterized protein n=1 Tax=Necator americanus TaxID=51031 RepID=A0ABR1EAZ3_NECAM